MKRLFLLLVIFMSTWQFVKAEATVNLDDNPSFELNVSSLSAVAGATIAQSSDAQAIGLYSAKVTPTSNTGDGVYRDYTLSAGEDYTFSFSIKGANGVDYQVYFYDNTATAQLGSAVTFTGDGTWRRQVVSITNGVNTDVSVYIVKNSDASTDVFYLDAFQLENLDHATTYGDGDQDGWIWTAGAHSSTSVRSAQSGEGGQVLDFDGADYDFTIEDALGVGAPPEELIQTEPAQGDGSDHQRTLARARNFQFAGDIVGSDRTDYLRNRLRLTRAVSRDRLKNDQPVPIRHRLGQNNIMIPARYAGGLEKNKIAGISVETVSVRLNAEQPFWRAAMGVANGDNGAVGIQGQGALTMTGQTTVSDADYILQRDSNGQWTAMGSGLSIQVGEITLTGGGGPSPSLMAAALGPDGALYIGGAFVSVNGVSAINIAKFDGVNWSALGSGVGTGASDYANSIIVDADNNIYVGGYFSTPGTNIAYWDGAWHAMGSGLGNASTTVNGLAIDSTGIIYAVGDFVASGATTLNGVAYWDGSWHAMGSTPGVSGGSATVFAVAIDSNDDVYIGGNFTTADSTTVNNIAKWSSGAFSALGTGTNGSVTTIVIDSDDVVYIGGSFTTAGGISANYAASYDTTWSAMAGFASAIYDMVITVTDTIYAHDGLDVFRWSGSDWPQLSSTTGTAIDKLTIDANGTMYALSHDVSYGYIERWNGNAWIPTTKAVRSIWQGLDGKIYVAGGYENAGGVANADMISYFDPTDSAWHALGTGADSAVNAIAEAPNGDIYIGGSFTSVNGVANTTGIAYYDVSAGTWNALSTGIDGTVLSLAFAPNGDLYIGGLFPDAGGVSDTKNLCKWTGSAFEALSNEPDGAVNTLAFDVSGNLYLGGAFENIGTTNVDYVAKYDPDTDTFSVLETGTNGYVNDLAIGPSGNLILVGIFTQAGSVSANYIANWNGSQFSNFGSGLNNVAYTVAVDSEGRIYVGGAFTTAGGVNLPDKVALWTGTTWTALDVDLPGTAAVEAILVTATDIYLGFDTSGSATAAGVDTAVYQGDAPGYPVFTATGPGRLYQLVNLTSGHEIYFDIELEDGEEVTLDLRPGYKTFTSSFRGSIPWAILEGSETETFQLLPGNNTISCLIDDASAEAYMLWDEYFHGFESVVFLPIVSN